MAEEVLTVFTTWPDLDTARTAARTLVEEKLAACGNIVPGVESVYRWEGKVETGAEVLVVFKTVIGSYQMFETRLRALHPYQVPEVLALRVTDGLPAYLRWVEQNCG
ncbi:MAG: divalent-cation tolerance protein CutA [Verrucomicrobia bacterium]|nr:MAG: divalent-cation tolerance protein CutA [Verrucomicrobiota bacterium]